MTRQRVLLALGVVLIASGVWFSLMRRPRPDDREKIIKMVVDFERAVEARKTSAVMAYISQDYEDASGYDRRAVQRLMLAAFQGGNPIDVVSQVGEVSIEGDLARVHVEADYSFGHRMETGASAHMAVDVTLQRERGGWKIIRADGWQGVGSEL